MMSPTIHEVSFLILLPMVGLITIPSLAHTQQGQVPDEAENEEFYGWISFGAGPSFMGYIAAVAHATLQYRSVVVSV